MGERENKKPWVQFRDMHSGGGLKEKWQHIYIQCSSEKEAKIIFYNRFGHSPDRVSCTCCGADYSVWEPENLRDATSFHRNAIIGEDGYETQMHEFREFIPFDRVLSLPDTLFIYDDEIKGEERIGHLPTHGYVWKD